MKRIHLEPLDCSPLFAILLLVILRSTNPIAIKFAINAGWPPFLLGVLRMAFIGFFVGIWIWIRRENPLGRDKKRRNYVLIASLCKGISVVFFYLALSRIPVNRVVIISTISPIISLIMVHLLLEQERVTIKRVVGVFVSFLGILLLLTLRERGLYTSLHTNINSALYSVSGDLFAIGNIIFLQGMIIYEKKALTMGATPRQLLNGTNIFSLVAFALCFSMSGEKLQGMPFTMPGIASYLYLVTLTGIFLFYYRRWLASKLEVSYINSFSHMERAVSIVWAVLLLGETISILSICSFGIILAGTFVAEGYR